MSSKKTPQKTAVKKTARKIVKNVHLRPITASNVKTNNFTKPINDDVVPLRMQQAREAAKRYQEQGKDEAESGDRMEIRMELIPAGDSLGLERILGVSDLLPVNFLLRGLNRAKSICRIHILAPSGRPVGYGTGFMVSPCLMLTNNHVLPDASHASKSLAEFGYEHDVNYHPQATEYFSFDPDLFFFTSKSLDFTLVAVKTGSHAGGSLDHYGFIPLVEESGKAMKGEKVSVIQHPNGMYKMLTIRNMIIEQPVNGEFVHYDADTEPGSSGSPVFNDQWEVVALHHSGVPKIDKNGRMLLKDGGGPYRSGMPEQLIDWVANEGVRISSIFRELRKPEHQWSRSQLECLVSLSINPAGIAGQEFGAKLAESRLEIAPVVSAAETAMAGPLSYTELLDLVSDPDVTEAQLVPYFIEKQPDETTLDPRFVVNERLVMIDHEQPQEAAGALNLANWICKKVRHQKYAMKMANSRLPSAPKLIRIVAEGDSWFQYPFKLHDVIDHLMDRDDLAVLCFSEAGDVLSSMVAKGEFYPALQRETPAYFLISGGGNDMVEGRGLRNLLQPFSHNRNPEEYLGTAWTTFLGRLTKYYEMLFKRVLTQNPNVRIICHGYDYAIPNNGVWLGKPMSEIGIKDVVLQEAIMRCVTDSINELFSGLANAAGGRVAYVDCRNSVKIGGWHDEFHPNSANYKIIADRIYQKICNW